MTLQYISPMKEINITIYCSICLQSTKANWMTQVKILLKGYFFARYHAVFYHFSPPNLLTNIWICNYFRTLLSNLLTCIRYDLIPIHNITHSDRHKCNHVDRNDTFMMLPVCMLASLPPSTPPPTNNLSKWVDHKDLTLVLNYRVASQG